MKDPGWRRGVRPSTSCELSSARLRCRGDSAGASRSARASCCALPSLGPEQHPASLCSDGCSDCSFSGGPWELRMSRKGNPQHGGVGMECSLHDRPAGCHSDPQGFTSLHRQAIGSAPAQLCSEGGSMRQGWVRACTTVSSL